MYTNKIPKKWTLKIQKSKIVSLVLKQSSISAVCWRPKNRTNRGIPVLWKEEMKEEKKWFTPGFEPATFHFQSEDIDHHTTEAE